MSDPLNTKYKLGGSGKKKKLKDLRREEPIVKIDPKINIVNPEPQERVEQLQQNPMVNATKLPHAITLEDLDRCFQDKIMNDWDIQIDGKRVEVLKISNSLHAQFYNTWKISDKKKDIQPPFIIMSRNSLVEQGTIVGEDVGMPPNAENYTIHSEMQLINGKEKRVSYKIPQPTAVDVSYTISFVCSRQRDLNKLNTKVIKFFQSKQYYCNCKGHYMPIKLESMSDASENETNSRRWMRQNYELKLCGYIICEDDMEVKINDTEMYIDVKVEEPKKQLFECIKGDCSKKSCPICFKYNFTKNTLKSCATKS